MQEAIEPTPPAGWQPCSPMLLRSGVDCCTAPRWSLGQHGPHWHPPAEQKNREVRLEERLGHALHAIDPKLLHYSPGLYVVHHIDYWDGEGDIRWSFANLDAHGKWTHDEGGKPLIEYERDEILQVIPLDAPVMPDSKVVGVTRDWLEEWEEELRQVVMGGGKMHSQIAHLLGLHPAPEAD